VVSKYPNEKQEKEEKKNRKEKYLRAHLLKDDQMILKERE